MAGALLGMTIYVASWINLLSLFRGEVTCSVARSWERGIEAARFDPSAAVLAANATVSPRLARPRRGSQAVEVPDRIP